MLPKGSVKSTVLTDLGVKGHGGVLKSLLTVMGIGVVQGSNPDQMTEPGSNNHSPSDGWGGDHISFLCSGEVQV